MTEPANKNSPTLLDRDVGWLEFNQRVLHEDLDGRTPLLERLKFLAIVSSNLDEFFMKRIGLLSRRLRDPSVYRHQQTLREKILAMMAAQADVYRNIIRPELARKGVHLLYYRDLTEDERHKVDELFRKTIYPVLTPLVVDPSHPFPFLSNLSQSLGILLKDPTSGDSLFARVKVPGHVPAWLRLESSERGDIATAKTFRFVRLMDVIRAHLDRLFPDMNVMEVMPFRVTRNAEVEDDDDDIEGSLIEHVAARLYADLGLLTCDPVLTADLVELFHSLTGGSKKRAYAKLLVAPVNMRERFVALIDREIANCQSGRPARIIAKMNQLEDRAMCQALVQASQAGVGVDLIIRGFCVLSPGVPGFTERVRVISVIGAFLEHSRIYYFQNGAADPMQGDYFIGSADWMERNLSRRVEAITPIEAPPLRQRLWQILQTCFQDHRQAWDMRPEGSYIQRTPESNARPDGPESLGTQAALMAMTLRSRS